MTERKVNILDVARHAQVSATTVSFVLNDKGHISEETRKRVLDAVHELGYLPDLRARSLKSQRIQTLTLLFMYSEESMDSSRYFRDLIAAICATASKYDYRIMVSLLSRGQSLVEQIRAFRQNGSSGGVIVVGPSPEEVDLIAVNLATFPGLVLSATSPHPNLGFIDVDNEGGMRQAIQHLMSLGHKRILYVTPQATDSHTVSRLIAYQEAMRSAGLGEYERVCVLSPDGDVDIELAPLLDVPLTAVIAFDDLRALQVQSFLSRNGVRVPEDIALIGFDDEDFGLHMSPSLTTLAQPFNEMGQIAAEKLIERIEDPSLSPARVISSLRLVIRESCGAYLGPRTSDASNGD